MIRTVVLVGHPDPGSLNHALAHAAVEAAAAFGPVALHDPAADGLDPRIPAAEARGAPTPDPLVARYIAELRDADLLVVVHPMWWGGPPAIAKGWIDRVFALDAAYALPKGDGGPPTGLLGLRRALIFNTSNTDAEREATLYGDPLERIWRDCILGFCGVASVERRVLRIVATSTAEERAGWIASVGAAVHDAASALGLSAHAPSTAAPVPSDHPPISIAPEGGTA